MSMTRPAGPLMAASSGQRGGSSVTGKGRGGSRSSRGGITSNWMAIRKKLCSRIFIYFILFFFVICPFESDSLWSDNGDFIPWFIFRWPMLWFVVNCQCYHPMAAEHIFFSYSSCRQLIKEAECVKIVSLAGGTQQSVQSSSCTHKHVLCITYCKSFFIISPHNPLMHCIAYCFIYM